MINGDRIRELTEGKDILAQSVKGNTLWLVERVGGISCIYQYRFEGEGYTKLSEADGPDQYFCPQKLLDMAPVTNSNWRAKVDDYWEGKRIAKEEWAKIKQAFKDLPDGKDIVIHFKPGWNLEFGILEDPIKGKVRCGGRLWKIRQRDSLSHWETVDTPDS